MLFPPGVLEQVLDCSGGDDISEESGRQRKLDALLALLRGQVLLAPPVTCAMHEYAAAISSWRRKVPNSC